jgi:hypothetical protein
MTVSSGNIAGVIKPIGMLKLPWCPCSGRICKIEEIPVNKKKKRKISVYEILNIDGHIMLEEAREKRYTVNGKRGIWRTIRGRHYFFPDDKSGVIPPIKGE